MSMLREGLNIEKVFEVKEEHLAKFLASGDVYVLSTPSMIAFMENVSRMLAEKYLSNEETTVGTKVCVRHLKPAPLGAEIRVKSTLTKIDGRRLTFKVEACWKDELIGEGEHERFIVNRDKFSEREKRLSTL